MFDGRVDSAVARLLVSVLVSVLRVACVCVSGLVV